ncbi:adenine phosphoribosyltransferase [Dionaea muscipula]
MISVQLSVAPLPAMIAFSPAVVESSLHQRLLSAARPATCTRNHLLKQNRFTGDSLRISTRSRTRSRSRSQQAPFTNCFSGDQGAARMDSQEDRIAKIASTIRVIPDFPKPGIMFQDITTLLLEPKAFKDTIDLFVERYKGKNISVVAGVEARGFIFGPPIALAIGAKFVPLRKPNKLPGEVISEEYSLEYGTDVMEMHIGAVEAGERAIVMDDLVATGGTLCTAVKLLERVGVRVVECACVIELPELKGRDRLGDIPLFVLVKAAGI